MTRHRKHTRPIAPDNNGNARATTASVALDPDAGDSPGSFALISSNGLDLEFVSTSPPSSKRTTLPGGSESIGEAQSPSAKVAADKLTESQALRKELEQLALMLDLTPKRRPKPKREPEVVGLYRPALTVRQIAQRIAPVIVAVGIMTGMASLRTIPPPTLPEALLGAWVTSNREYAGRELGFVDSEINLRLRPDAELMRYPITEMKTRESADGMSLALTYATETGPVELNVRLISGVHPKLIFDRPTGLVWEHPAARQ